MIAKRLPSLIEHWREVASFIALRGLCTDRENAYLLCRYIHPGHSKSDNKESDEPGKKHLERIHVQVQN